MNNIHDFMFSKKNYLALKKIDTPPQKKEITKPRPKRSLIHNVLDKFFWCYYILKYGSLKYEMIGKDHFKFKMAECLKI